MFLIDSNIAIHLRDGDAEITALTAALPVRPKISLLTRVELEGGMHVVPQLLERRRIRWDALMTTLAVLAFAAAVVDAYARVVEASGFSRAKIIDRLIAASAIVHDLTLITMNGDDFRDIPNLKLEIWLSPR